MSIIENPYWNEAPYMHGGITMYDREKMQYVKPGEVCDFGIKKGDNNMNEKYEFMHGWFGAPAYVDTDNIAELIAERDKARLDYVDVLRREYENGQKAKKAMTIEKVIFNPPATIVFWADGAKTVVKCQSDEPFDPEKGLAMAFMKKILGNKGNYFNLVKKYTEGCSPVSNETRDVAPGINCDEAIKENFKKDK